MMDGENRRSREAVRNSIRTYGVKVMDPASLPLKKTGERESQESVSRFSEKPPLKEYQKRKGVLNRIPYATLVGTIISLLGVIIYGISSERVLDRTKNMFHEIFNEKRFLLQNLGVSSIVLEAITAIYVALILVLAALASGDTRSSIFSKRKAKIAGWALCLFFLVGTVVFLAFWMFVFGLSCSFIIAIYTCNSECDLHQEEGKESLHLTILNAYFGKKGTFYTLSDPALIKKFCKDYVEKVSSSCGATVGSSALVVFGLIMLMTCLAANYTRIRTEGKLQELEELRRLDGNHQVSGGRF